MKAKVFAAAPFSSHTHKHMQAGGWKISLLPRPLFCAVMKTAVKGCDFMQLWYPYHFCHQAPLGDLQDPNECSLVFSLVPVLQGKDITSSLVCGGLGWELCFFFSKILRGKIMKSKSCFTAITSFPLNSWHLLSVNQLPCVAGICDSELKVDF